MLVNSSVLSAIIEFTKFVDKEVLDHEFLCLIDSMTGDVLASSAGSSEAVELTEEVEDNIIGNILIHNHPEYGSTLSLPDLEVALIGGASMVAAYSDRDKTLTYLQIKCDLPDRIILEMLKGIKSIYGLTINSSIQSGVNPHSGKEEDVAVVQKALEKSWSSFFRIYSSFGVEYATMPWK
jgi:hypothetical protein